MDITAKMLRILLINDTPKKVGRLRAALIEAGFDVIDGPRSAWSVRA